MPLARRTPLRSKTGFKQGGSELKRTPFKRKPASDAAQAAEFRRIVLGRSDRCQVGAPGCAVRATIAHHVLARGSGGGSKHDPDLGLAVCPPCHREIHANPTEAYERGWLLRHGSPDV